MKIAIMQPYFFPYLGYFQLINAVDKFVVSDDVNYIKKGWINRNYILINNRAKMFTVPLRKVSSNKLIKDLKLATSEKWKKKFLKTIQFSYERAPYFEKTFSIINEVINTPANLIIKWHLKSIYLIKQYLDIETEIIESEAKYKNRGMNSQEIIIDICKKERSSDYINAIGGMKLYDKEDFKKHNINLYFIKTDKNLKYKQFNNKFVPNLSIIDVMMFNSPREIKGMLNEYSLV
ncbi:MAG: WbqC family protein [Candidatus Marinimicrobia bacterium]|nr:WbqC family protein [Candidatus Neomarinimicrobiota bacterium]